MYRLLLLPFIALILPAQTPSQSLDKPTQDVDDALRARIKQFYDLHVAAKYRQAEQLIAEESKDDFYVLSKPDLKSYRIGSIEYSENFTKAKVMIIGAMPVLLPMAGGKIMDIPFASFDVTIWSSVEVNTGLACAAIPATSWIKISSDRFASTQPERFTRLSSVSPSTNSIA